MGITSPGITSFHKTPKRPRKTLGARVIQRAESFEKNFEARFQRIARDPRLLSFVASSLNYAAATRIEAEKLRAEIASLRAHVAVASFRARRKTPR